MDVLRAPRVLATALWILSACGSSHTVRPIRDGGADTAADGGTDASTSRDAGPVRPGVEEPFGSDEEWAYSEGDQKNPAVAWLGDRYLVAWTDHNDGCRVYARYVEAAGAFTGHPFELPIRCGWLAVGGNVRTSAIASMGFDDLVELRRLGPTGEPLDPVAATTAQVRFVYMSGPRLLSVGDQLAVTWPWETTPARAILDLREPFGATFPLERLHVDASTSPSSAAPMTWNGESFIAAYRDGSNHVRASAFRAGSEPAAYAHDFGPGGDPIVVSVGTETYVAFANAGQTWAWRTGPDGGPVGYPIETSPPTAATIPPPYSVPVLLGTAAVDDSVVTVLQQSLDYDGSGRLEGDAIATQTSPSTGESSLLPFGAAAVVGGAMASDGSSALVALVARTLSAQYDVDLYRLPSGERIGTVATARSRHWPPAVAGADGGFVIGWPEARGTEEGPQIYLARLSVDGTWSSAAPIGSSPGPPGPLLLGSTGGGSLVSWSYAWRRSAVAVDASDRVEPVGLPGEVDGLRRIFPRPDGYLLVGGRGGYVDPYGYRPPWSQRITSDGTAVGGVRTFAEGGSPEYECVFADLGDGLLVACTILDECAYSTCWSDATIEVGWLSDDAADVTMQPLLVAAPMTGIDDVATNGTTSVVIYTVGTERRVQIFDRENDLVEAPLSLPIAATRSRVTAVGDRFLVTWTERAADEGGSLLFGAWIDPTAPFDLAPSSIAAADYWDVAVSADMVAVVYQRFDDTAGATRSFVQLFDAPAPAAP